MSSNIEKMLRITSCKHFWGDVDKVEIPTLDNPLSISEEYRYYIGAKLLIRRVNGIIVGHVLGEKAMIAYRELGGEVVVTFHFLLEILSVISKFSTKEIVSNSQKEELVCCRQLIFWHYKNLKDTNNSTLTLAEIGNLINRDHATVLFSFKSVEEEDKYKKKFQLEYKTKFINQLRSIYSIYNAPKYDKYKLK